jgi:hypothetical protein
MQIAAAVRLYPSWAMAAGRELRGAEDCYQAKAFRCLSVHKEHWPDPANVVQS